MNFILAGTFGGQHCDIFMCVSTNVNLNIGNGSVVGTSNDGNNGHLLMIYGLNTKGYCADKPCCY